MKSVSPTVRDYEQAAALFTRLEQLMSQLGVRASGVVLAGELNAAQKAHMVGVLETADILKTEFAYQRAWNEARATSAQSES